MCRIESLKVLPNRLRIEPKPPIGKHQTLFLADSFVFLCKGGGEIFDWFCFDEAQKEKAGLGTVHRVAQHGEQAYVGDVVANPIDSAGEV